MADERPGLDRLRAALANWLAYLQSCPLPGGCLLSAAAAEFDGRPGPVRDVVVADTDLWRATLQRDAEVAVRAGELPADTDPAQLVFELEGVALAVNRAVQLDRDAGAARRGRQAVDRLLGA